MVWPSYLRYYYYATMLQGVFYVTLIYSFILYHTLLNALFQWLLNLNLQKYYIYYSLFLSRSTETNINIRYYIYVYFDCCYARWWHTFHWFLPTLFYFRYSKSYLCSVYTVLKVPFGRQCNTNPSFKGLHTIFTNLVLIVNSDYHGIPFSGYRVRPLLHFCHS